jgi:hypothetical protein
MKQATPLLVLAAVVCTGCAALTQSPPKTPRETEAEARAGKVPDSVRDPRPEMPPMGPLAMPMR